MGRSKLYNNKEAKQLVAAQESLDQAPRGDLNRGGKGGVLGVKQRGKFVRDTRRRAKTENNWLSGLLLENAERGSEARARCESLRVARSYSKDAARRGILGYRCVGMRLERLATGWDS